MTASEDMIAAVLDTLEGVAAFLEQLPADVYTAPMSDCLDATVGQHIRHSLDHFATLAHGLDEGDLDYDARRRETEVETDPAQAVAVARSLAGSLATSLRHEDLGRAVRVRTASDRQGEIAWQSSSLGREMQFVISHTVHHLAMVASSCRRRGLTVSEDFGVAPSTLRHRDSLAGRK